MESATHHRSGSSGLGARDTILDQSAVLSPCSNGVMASRTAISSIVLGITTSRPSAIPRMVARNILPDRVLGRAGTITTSFSAATGPISSRTAATIVLRRVCRSTSTPAYSTTKARGIWPFISSWTPMTAHSATISLAATTASSEPVESRCPATFITSSVRPIT